MPSEVQIRVGSVPVGGGAPVAVQSMTLTKTHDVAGTTAQIAALASAGCEIVRVAVPKNEDAAALSTIVRLSPPRHRGHPLQRLARSQGDRGGRRRRADQPGNIGGPDKVEHAVNAAKRAGIPMRIGANSGSLPKHLHHLAQQDQAEALVAAALEEVELLERLDYRDFKVSVKATHADDDPRLPDAGGERPYPLHLGVTEAGTELQAGSRARSASARCSRTGSGTRCASRSPPTP